MIEPNTINDGHEPEETPKRVTVPIAKSEALTRLLARFAALREAVMQDNPVTNGMLESAEESLSSERFVVGDESVTMAELQKIPELKRTLELWREIEYGDYSHIGEVRYANDAIIKILTEGTLNLLYLDQLQGMTDRQAAMFGEWKGGYLSFDSITELTDRQLDSLVRPRREGIYLHGLRKISDTQAISLGESGANELYLTGLETLSENQARDLAKFQGNRLRLQCTGSLTHETLFALFPLLPKLQCDPALRGKIQATVQIISKS